MAVIVPKSWQNYILGLSINAVAPQDLKLRLFANNLTPTVDSVIGDMTQAAGFGYAELAMIPGSWTRTPGAPYVAAYPATTFTFTGAIGLIYGWYIVTADGLILGPCERFPLGPYNKQTNGETIQVPPQWSMLGV